VSWLLKDARRRTCEAVQKFAVEHRLIDVVLGMSLPADDSGVFCESMKAAYEEQLMLWLPNVTEATLLANGERRDAANVNAFIDAAVGHARTMTLIETENGNSICGAFLVPAWAIGGIRDPRLSSFLFTLENHLDVAPTKFAQRENEFAAQAVRDKYVCFGGGECVIAPCEYGSNLGVCYRDAVGHGAAILNGDHPAGLFYAARWELWETR
jgi:hypothetical protein